MRKVYKKDVRQNSLFSYLIKPFYKVIYFFILFFILIGDSVLFFLTTSVRGIYHAFQLLFKFFAFAGRYVYQYIIDAFIPLSQEVQYVSKLSVFYVRKAHAKKISITLPQWKLPSVTMPAWKMPQWKLRLPRVKLPHISFKLPSITLPKISLPKIKIVLPKLNIKLPKLPLGHIKAPKHSFPKFSFPHITLPRFSFKRVQSESQVEEVVIIKPEKRKTQKLPKFSLPFFTTRIRYFMLGTFFALAFVAFQQSYFFVKALPSPKLIGSINYPLSTHLYDRNGKLLYEVYHDQNRTPVNLKDLPPYIAQATIAIEDKDFYHHKGVSLISGIGRALKETIIEKNPQGGSTITQQLVKTALLSPERTFERKVKEIILALWTEQLYTKDQIMGMYLNQVAYGGSSYGIEEASKTYFAKDAKDLSLEEAALLAGLPQAPTLYSPYTNPDAAVSRRNDVLRKMKEQGYITVDQEKQAKTKELAMVPLKTNIKAPHFVFYVKSQLEEKYGIQQVEEGGMKVTTSLDLKIQEESEKILREELEKIKNLDVTNGGILVTKPSTGEILAMVGSVDYFAQPSGAFNVTTALRQPGSSIKPVMYSLALEKGYTAASILDDTPIVFAVSGGESYRPVNYDGKFHGKVPFRIALANSYNIPAVKLLNSVGVNQMVAYAKNMGITTWDDSSRFGLSLTLGGGEVTMMDMATVFGVFANKGYRTELTPIDKIEDSHGDTYAELAPNKVKVVNEANAYIISDILSDNFARQLAFGPHSALEIPGYKVAVKTGTTDSKKDNWTIGYTPEFAVTVWVGNNDNHPMNPNLTSGITGAAPIWSRVMTYLMKNYATPNIWFPKPETVTEQTCYFGRKEFFMKGTEKNSFCNKALLETTNPSVSPKPIN